VCSHTIGFTPGKIGLTASNQAEGAAEIPADFDFFALEYEEAYRIFLPLVARSAD
jgi:hypothetical protein